MLVSPTQNCGIGGLSQRQGPMQLYGVTVEYRFKGIINMTPTWEEILGCRQPSYQAKYQPSGSPAGSALRLIPGLVFGEINSLVPSPQLVSCRYRQVWGVLLVLDIPHCVIYFNTLPVLYLLLSWSLVGIDRCGAYCWSWTSHTVLFILIPYLSRTFSSAGLL